MRYLDYLKRFTYTPNEFYDHLKGLEDAAGGDMAFVVLPAMTGDDGTDPALTPTASEANPEEGEYSVTVTVKLMNQAKTKVMEWFNGKRKVTVDNGSSAGTLSINGDTPGSAGTNVTFDLEFENGVGEFTVTLGDTWEEDETVKINVNVDGSNQTVSIMGYTVKTENHFLIKVVEDPQE